MLKKIHVFDNIVNKKHQKIIKDTLLDVNFPWFFAEDITYTNNKKQSRPAFKHYFVIDRKVNSSFHKHILPIINNSLNSSSEILKDIEKYVGHVSDNYLVKLKNLEKNICEQAVSVVKKENKSFVKISTGIFTLGLLGVIGYFYCMKK